MRVFRRVGGGVRSRCALRRPLNVVFYPPGRGVERCSNFVAVSPFFFFLRWHGGERNALNARGRVTEGDPERARRTGRAVADARRRRGCCEWANCRKSENERHVRGGEARGREGARGGNQDGGRSESDEAKRIAGRAWEREWERGKSEDGSAFWDAFSPPFRSSLFPMETK